MTRGGAAFRAAFLAAAAVASAPLAPGGGRAQAAGKEAPAPPPAEADDGVPDSGAPEAAAREAVLQPVYRGQRVGEPVLARLRGDGSALLQLDALLAALRVEHSTAPGGAVSGRLHPGDTSFRFDPDGSYRVGWLPRSLGRGDFAVVDGALLVSAAALARLLPVRLRVDERRQTVVVEATGPLPLDLERAREAQRARLAARTPSEPPPLSDFPYEAFGRPFGDVRVSLDSRAAAGSGSPLRYDGLLSGEVGYATALLFFLGDGAVPLRDARLRLGREAPLGGAFGVPGLTSAFGGDVSPFAVPLVGRPGQSRGVAVSAFPLDRPDNFDRTAVEGDAPPGWDVELYRGAELLGIQRAGPDGRFRFEDVALEFGDNVLRVLLYGPEGQVREEVRRFQIGGGMAPPGVVYWRGFVGQPNRRLLSFMLPGPDGGAAGLGYSGEVEVGLSSFLTAHAFGARAPEAPLLGSPLRSTYGGGLRLSVANVYLEGEAALQAEGGRAWRVGGIAGLGGLTLSGRHAQYDGFRTIEATRSLSPLRSASSVRLSHSVPLAGFGLGLSAIGERFEGEDGTVETSVRGDVRFGLFGLFFSHEIDLRRFAYADGPAAERVFYRPTVSTSFRNLRLSASARIDTATGNVDEVIATASYRFSDRTFASVSASRLSALDQRLDSRDRFAASASLSRDFGPFFASLTVARDADESYFVGVGLNASFGFDRFGRLALSSRPMALQGSADVLVYHDRDGDGRYDPETDAPVRDARLRLNGFRSEAARTDEAGRAFLPGLATTRPVTVEVEQPSLPDPFLAPVDGGVRFLPRPGQPFAAAIAVAETGEVSGSIAVERDGTAVPLAGVVLELLEIGGPGSAAEPAGPGLRLAALLPWAGDGDARGGASRGGAAGAGSQADAAARGYVAADRPAAAGRGAKAGGHVRRTTRSQFDGAFLFDLVPPGRYAVRIRPGQTVRGAPLEPVAREVTVGRDALMVDGVDFRMAPPPSGEAPDRDAESARDGEEG